MANALIDWQAAKTHVLINPRLPEPIQQQLKDAVLPYQEIEEHIWIASSGTENFPKMIALSKGAFLASAKAVNAHLRAERKDAWLNVLPLFHVGGLSIYARALLTDSVVIDHSHNKWNPVAYTQALHAHAICFSSLTPTHVYDLVANQMSPPTCLKAIVVGGGALSDKLHANALQLGWPLFTSYGMTEACSQIATSKKNHLNLERLSHMQLRFDACGHLSIKSTALLTGFVQGNDPYKAFIDPKVDGWYLTQDKGGLEDGVLRILGRDASFMKIGGENINFAQLEQVWEDILLAHGRPVDAVLIDMPCQRLGKMVCLAACRSAEHLVPLINEFQARVLPIAKIRAVYSVCALPRTSLHKLKKNDLRDMLKSNNLLHSLLS